MCKNAPETPLLYLDNHSQDRARIWYVHRDPSPNGFALVKCGMHPHVRTCHVHNPLKIWLLYLDSYLTDRAQIWYAHWDSLAKGVGLVKRGYIRTCARATCTTSKKSFCYILTTTGPILLKSDIQIETEQLIRLLCARSLIAQKASSWFIIVSPILALVMWYPGTNLI